MLHTFSVMTRDTKMASKGTFEPYENGTNDQRWDRIRIAGVDSGRILRFSFGPGVKIL